MFRPRRSALFVPAANARALEKARQLEADVIILDLEDAVAPAQKIAARQALVSAIPALAPRETVIRINSAAAPWHEDDIGAAIAARPDAILLPKLTDAGQVRATHARTHGVPLWAMIETPRAVLNVSEIARAGVECLVFGSNDLLHAMEGRHRPDRVNLWAAMSLCVLAARAAGIAVLDGVHNAIDDASGFAEACTLARDFGFDGKSLIHPGQIAAANAAFSPSPDEVAQARRVLDAFAAAPDTGVIALDGRMLESLDADIARRTLARAGSRSDS